MQRNKVDSRMDLSSNYEKGIYLQFNVVDNENDWVLVINLLLFFNLSIDNRGIRNCSLYDRYLWRD